MKICTEIGTNMGKLQPIRCGCGGEAEVDCYLGDLSHYDLYYVYCKKCYIQSANYKTKDEAITVWNKAMGERTAKVEQQRTCWEDIRPYKEGMCASCGRDVYDHAKYCDECGARLEWK